MRIVRRSTLKDMIIARELDAGRSLRILEPVAEALDSAHRAGLIHRDIKPQNIMVGERDQPYLTDFGLTKAPGDRSLTKTGQFLGSIDYISPEQIRGERASPATDIYSLAAVLYECLTGVVPFPKESDVAVLYAHIADEPPRVSDQRPDLPAGLDDVLRSAMAKRPDDRHASALELLEDARRAFSHKTRAAMRPPGRLEAPEEVGVHGPERADDTDARRESEPPAGPTAPARGVVDTARQRASLERVGEARDGEGVSTPASEPAGRTEREWRFASGAAPVTDAAASPTNEPLVAASAPAAAAAPAPRFETASSKAAPHPSATGAPEWAGPSAPRAATVRERPRRLPPAAALAAALVVAAAGAGALIGSRSSGGGSESTSSASQAGVGLTFPADWKTLADDPEIPGLRFREPLSIAPGGSDGGGGLVAGQVDAGGATLLPRSFLERLREPPAREDMVRLGDQEAYRYVGLRPRGFSRALTLYVVPTSEGVATIGCFAPRAGGRGVLDECSRVAATLEVSDASTYPLGPSEAYAEMLKPTLDRLAAQRTAGRRRLRSASGPAGQAGAAEGLARAFSTAALGVRKISPTPADNGAHASLVAALGRTATAYERLGAALRRGSRGGFAAARRGIRAGEAAVDRSLDAHRRLGYATS